MVNMALPHYTPLSGNYVSATSASAKSHAESMRQLVPSLGMERFTFWIQAVTVSWDPGCRGWFFVDRWEQKSFENLSQ